MKLTTFLNRSAMAALLLSASVSVFATPPRLAQSDWHQFAHEAPTSAPIRTDVDVRRAPATTVAAAPAQNTATIPAGGEPVQGKSREQVRAELLQAREAGWLPTSNAHYPPSAEMRERNRVQFQRAENWWRAHGDLNAAAQ